MLAAHYFNGRSTRLNKVELSLAGETLVIAGEGVDLSIPFGQVTVDERLGRAARRIRLPGGAFCEVSDLAGLDELLAEAGHRDGSVDRLQRHWRIAFAAVAICVGLAVAAYLWGLPLAADIGAHHLPSKVGRVLSAQTIKALDGHFFQTSTLTEERRTAITARYRELRLPEGGSPQGDLLFRQSIILGANAFTLSDGRIVLLDDLVTRLDDDEIVAVLSHELGHAHGRHGLQMLLRSSAIGAFWTLYLGDISQLLAAAPTVLMQAHYSRDLEREADDYGATLLTANGLSPALLADTLEKLAAAHKGSGDMGYLNSHPSNDDRISKLRGGRAS